MATPSAGHPKANNQHNVKELLTTHDSLVDAERVLPSDSPEIGLLCLRLADLYEGYERYAEAEPLYKRALSIIEKKGERHTKTIDRVGQDRFDVIETAKL